MQQNTRKEKKEKYPVKGSCLSSITQRCKQRETRKRHGKKSDFGTCYKHKYTHTHILIHAHTHMYLTDGVINFCFWKQALDDLIYLSELLFNLYFGLLFIMQNNLLIFYSAEHLISVKLYLLACITVFCLVFRQYKIFQIIHNSDWLQNRKLLKSWKSQSVDGSRAFGYTKSQVNYVSDGMTCYFLLVNKLFLCNRSWITAGITWSCEKASLQFPASEVSCTALLY